ncbi:hypothetical protein ACTXT7_002667 [Hymenolepis weldensis]
MGTKPSTTVFDERKGRVTESELWLATDSSSEVLLSATPNDKQPVVKKSRRGFEYDAEPWTASVQPENDRYHHGFPQVSITSGGAMRLYVSMRCEATFLGKTISKECYIADRNINLVSLNWIDELNPTQFTDEKNLPDTYSRT